MCLRVRKFTAAVLIENKLPTFDSWNIILQDKKTIAGGVLNSNKYYIIVIIINIYIALRTCFGPLPVRNIIKRQAQIIFLF